MSMEEPSNRKVSRKKRRRRKRPVNVAASVLTTFGLYCGITSIFASIQLDHDRAAYWMIAAIVLDMLDGTVARLTKSVSEFGKELDSLSDVVSFGAAPAVLIYTFFSPEEAATKSVLTSTASMMAVVFVICTALRLARYNTFQSERQDIFFGLPSPAAAGTIASFALFTKSDLFLKYLNFHFQTALWIFIPVILILSLLMVSNVQYPKRNVRLFVLGPRKAFQFLVMCVAGIALFNLLYREYSLAVVWLPLATLYVSTGLVHEIRARLRKSSAAEGDEKPNLPGSDAQATDQATEQIKPPLT